MGRCDSKNATGPPELLLELQYNQERMAGNVREVCVGAVGCIMGELLKHAPLFPGRTEIGMLDLFTKLLGSPHDVWKARLPPCGL